MLLDGLKTIWKETLSLKSSRSIPGLQEAIDSQNRIGWWALICGRWSKEWEITQQRYFRAIKSPKSVKRWQVSLIRLLWNTSWDFWDHRNSIEHRTNNQNIEEVKRTLEMQVRIQWQLGPPSLYERQYYKGVESILKKRHRRPGSLVNAC